MTAWLAMIVAAVASSTKRQQAPGRRHQEERVRHRLGARQHQAALAEVVERERREDEPEPRRADRPASEVAHVGVERLDAGDGEEDRAHHRQRAEPVRRHEADGVRRVEGVEDREAVAGVHEAEQRHHHEPDEGDRSEEDRDPARAAALHPEEPDDDRHGHGDDVAVELRRHELEPLERRKDRDRRRDRGVAVEERGPEHAEHEEERRPPPDRALGEREQRQRAALAVVVGPEDQPDVLEGDDEDQRPDQHRGDADHLRLDEPVAAGRVQRLAHGVERAGADVAVDDADRAESERPESGSVPVGLDRCGGAHACLVPVAPRAEF